MSEHEIECDVQPLFDKLNAIYGQLLIIAKQLIEINDNTSPKAKVLHE